MNEAFKEFIVYAIEHELEERTDKTPEVVNEYKKIIAWIREH